MQDGRESRGVKAKARRFRPVISWSITGLLLVGVVLTLIYFFFLRQAPVAEPETSGRDPVAERRAEVNTQVLRGEQDNNALESAVSNASTDPEKALILQEYAAYTMVQENLSDESAQKALVAAQRAYELDNQLSSLWTIVKAAKKLGQTELAEVTELKIEEQLREVERHG